MRSLVRLTYYVRTLARLHSQRIHFLRNLTEEGVLEITHADILTKALSRDLFEFHSDFVLGSRSEKMCES